MLCILCHEKCSDLKLFRSQFVSYNQRSHPTRILILYHVLYIVNNFELNFSSFHENSHALLRKKNTKMIGSYSTHEIWLSTARLKYSSRMEIPLSSSPLYPSLIQLAIAFFLSPTQSGSADHPLFTGFRTLGDFKVHLLVSMLLCTSGMMVSRHRK